MNKKHILCISGGKDSMATAIEEVDREISMQAAQMRLEGME